MKKTTTLLLLATVMLGTGMGTASAQYNATNNLFYHTFRTPQSNQLNPAFFPTRNSFYLQLPMVGLQLGSPLAINHILRDTVQDGQHISVIDINRIVNQLNVDNKFNVGADLDILGLGFKVHHTFFNVSGRLRINTSVGIPTGIIDVLNQGNLDENNQPIPLILNLEDVLAAQMYAEGSFGIGHYFAPIGLTVGAHAKMLVGIENVNLNNSRIEMTTYNDADGNLERIKLDAYYQAQAAGLVPLDTNADGSLNTEAMKDVRGILKNLLNNTGFAFDIGARYDMGPFSFSFSVLDLSTGIHWRSNVSTLSPIGGHDTISFSGVDVNEMLNNGTVNMDTIEKAFGQFVDNIMPRAGLQGDGYTYSIPTRINLGASYSFARILRAGLLFHGQFDKGLFEKNSPFRWNTTLSFGVNAFDWAELIVGSSVVYDGAKISPLNPGVGLIITPGTALQLYVMADYVSSIYLAEARALNLKVGLNLLIGRGGFSRLTRN